MQVVRLRPYLRAIRSMGLDDTDMRRIEADILRAPERYPIIRGLKGARKARFAMSGRGKSGGGRVIYFVSLGQGILAMLTAYAKNVQEDLTPADQKALLK